LKALRDYFIRQARWSLVTRLQRRVPLGISNRYVIAAPSAACDPMTPAQCLEADSSCY
jgi:hypothetical protein